jgi:DeoR family transcriptional regulator of aga operon/DeoR family fructose operon transcriptional repressor
MACSTWCYSWALETVKGTDGFTNDYLPETMTDRAILNIAPKVTIVADHRKFGRVSSVQVGTVTTAHSIITNKVTSKACINELIDLGIEIIQV